MLEDLAKILEAEKYINAGCPVKVRAGMLILDGAWVAEYSEKEK